MRMSGGGRNENHPGAAASRRRESSGALHCARECLPAGDGTPPLLPGALLGAACRVVTGNGLRYGLRFLPMLWFISAMPTKTDLP
jgi:hypothetical protein